MPPNMYYPILKFRTNNHNFPIETGRWQNIRRTDRICNLCNSPAVGDEFHYLFRCEALLQQRLKYLPHHYLRFPNLMSMKQLMTTNNTKLLRNLSIFLSHAFKAMRNPRWLTILCYRVVYILQMFWHILLYIHWKYLCMYIIHYNL